MSLAQRRWAELIGSGAVRLDGFHAVKHALRFGAQVPLIAASDRDRVRWLAQRLAPDLAAVLDERVQELDLAGLTGVVHHTGVCALALPRQWLPAELNPAAPVVLLDQPRDPGNYGAVIRVAAGLGVAGVLSTGPLDPWQPAVVRGAAGLQYALPVLRIEVDAVPADRPVVALDAGGRDARGVQVPDTAVLAFGSERTGLSDEVRARADLVLALPMRAGVASYNLATSVAMVLYQWSLRGTTV